MRSWAGAALLPLALALLWLSAGGTPRQGNVRGDAKSGSAGRRRGMLAGHSGATEPWEHVRAAALAKLRDYRAGMKPPSRPAPQRKTALPVKQTPKSLADAASLLAAALGGPAHAESSPENPLPSSQKLGLVDLPSVLSAPKDSLGSDPLAVEQEILIGHGPDVSNVITERNGTVKVVVEATASRKFFVIQKEIYGINDWLDNEEKEKPWLRQMYQDAGVTIIRKGGNPASRYNWENHAENRGEDYFFESLPKRYVDGLNSFDYFVRENKAAGIESMGTVPIMDWLPKSSKPDCSFRVSKYGKQQEVDPYMRDCGNGMYPNGNTVLNDPTDANVKKGPDHQRRWIEKLTQDWGDAANGGVKYWSLDNEPLWWHAEHRDIHRNHSGYDEILERGIRYASAIKDADPTALVTGPVTAGWYDLFYSFKDMHAGWKRQNGEYWLNPVDQQVHGGTPFLQWYLEQMRLEGERQGRKLLDVVDVHLYLAEEAQTDNANWTMQWQRIAATRALWDPDFSCGFCAYLDPVNCPSKKPRVLTRIAEMIMKAAPGMKIAVTEYRFGGRKDISGAIAQAEALGIFGKLSVAMAMVFPNPGNDTVLMAFRMYRNYDGKGSSFGSLGVNSWSTDHTRVSVYAALTGVKGTLTVLLINRRPGTQPVTVSLDIAPTGPIKAYQYSNEDLTAILRKEDLLPLPFLDLTLPGYSLTMLEVPIK